MSEALEWTMRAPMTGPDVRNKEGPEGGWVTYLIKGLGGGGRASSCRGLKEMGGLRWKDNESRGGFDEMGRDR